MDVEAEILDLKRRMQAFEAARCSDDDAPTSTGVTEVKRLISDMQVGMTDDVGALSVEIAGLRWQADEFFRATRVRMTEQFDALRVDMIKLEVKIDQLLKDRE